MGRTGEARLPGGVVLSVLRRTRPLHVGLISTGGTIEKTYDTRSGILANHVHVLDVVLDRLELRGVVIDRVALMNKDSLDMTDADHQAIADCVHEQAKVFDAVVVVHGTDRLAKSAEQVLAVGVPKCPVVFTGAMRPYELRRTDSAQNLAEALLAAQLIDTPGVYLAMHNQVLAFPGVVKDHELGTFRYQ